MLYWLSLIVAGLLIGLVNVAIGGAGGIIYVGVMTAILETPPAIAASTSLAIMIPTAAAGTWSHWRAGNIHKRLGWRMLQGGLVGALAGTACSGRLNRDVYDRVIGSFMLYLSLQMLVTHLRRRGRTEAHEEPPAVVSRGEQLKALAFGTLGGAMSGLVGASGSTPIIAGLTLMRCSAVQTVGTSVMVVLGLSVAGFVMRLGVGSVDWCVVLALVSGSVLGAYSAPRLLARVDRATLNRRLAPTLLFLVAAMGISLLLK